MRLTREASCRQTMTDPWFLSGRPSCVLEAQLSESSKFGSPRNFRRVRMRMNEKNGKMLLAPRLADQPYDSNSLRAMPL